MYQLSYNPANVDENSSDIHLALLKLAIFVYTINLASDEIFEILSG